MRQVLAGFLREVRAAGVPVSTAESIDALGAAAAVGLERDELREALAAAVVKEESDRSAFDDVFDRFFAAGGAEERRRAKRRAAAGGEGGGQGRAPGEGRGRGERQTPPAAADPRPERATRQTRSEARPDESRRSAAGRGEAPEVARRRRARALLRRPFRDLEPPEAEELRDLAAELARRFRARLSRRRRVARRGRLDFRRTLRRSVAHGGVPFDLVLRRRRPGKVDLVALCDVSGSVRHASELFAALVAPSASFFRRVRIFAYVDRPVEASAEGGRLVPHGPIDFHAFSDLGRVLEDLEASAAGAFTRSTVLLVLGDARNNRRPARADVLARLRARVRALWWLVPEVRARWDTGDSALAAYRPHADRVLECADAASLFRALGDVAA